MDEAYESTLDGLLVSHEKLQLRNISMLEYMDFP
jgi:cobalt-zinc-cadmium efflux system outer membrane protein